MDRKSLLDRMSKGFMVDIACSGVVDVEKIADFILADRKAVLERVKKPLVDIKHEDQTRTDGWVTDYQLWQAVDKALEEIDRIEKE